MAISFALLVWGGHVNLEGQLATFRYGHMEGHWTDRTKTQFP